MLKKLIPIGIAILTVLSGIMVVFHAVIFYIVPKYLLSRYLGIFDGAASIGIIGSADGPTSIYLVDTAYEASIPVFLVLFIAGILYFILMKYRKNRKQ